MGPGSGLAASVGGGLSHHSGGGGGCTKYGECTENCIGLEVVLGNGDVIKMGSGANQYVKRPFVRAGLGPDLMGIFLGDNGTMGIKTEATLKIFHKPPFFSGKTFLISENPYENARDMTKEMIKRGWVKNFGIYDMFFVPPPSIMGITLDELITTWGDITGGVMVYVHEAYDEKVLERNSEILEGIAKKYSTRELGPTPEEGNITDWFYGEQGHWQFFHIEFSMMGPGYQPCTTEIKVPISKFAEILHEIDKWGEEHEEELFEVEAEVGVSTVHMLEHNSCYIGGGLSTISNDEDIKDDVIQLWKENLEFLLKLGGVLYMVGQIGSHVLVDSRFFSDEYYNFFKKVKGICDPNNLISPGKFRF
jgi:FAD/FMN-containing dehydrogenase